MATRMQQRRGTAAQWTAANPTLAAGEIGFETDTSKFKMGNGSSAWTALTYFANAAELAAIIDGAPALLNTLDELALALGDDPQFLTTIATNLSTHANDTTNIHGIVDTNTLATLTNVNAAIQAADGALSTHTADTTSVHGILDTSLLATTANVATALSSATSALTTHSTDTTDVHGIVNTADLVTQSDLTDAISGAEVDFSTYGGTGIDWNSVNTRFDIDSTVATKTYADNAVSTHQEDTTNVHGIADTSVLATATTVATAKSEAIAAAGTAADTKVSTAVAALTKSSVGLANVDNTSDANKPVSTAVQTALDLKETVANVALKAPLASPALTGVPTAPTAAAATNTTQVATTAYVRGEVAALVNSAGATLDTLGEIATALGNDANLSTTLTTAIGLKAPIASPTFTGTVTIPAGASISGFAPLASPTFTGTNNVAALTASGLITASASGVAFTDGTQTKEGVQSRTPIIQKTASYTLSALSERDSMIEMGSASALTLTVPSNATVAWPVGTSIDILQTGAGQVTITAGAGVTVNGTPGLKLRTQWSGVTLFKRATDTWVVYGDLTA
jgi:hypothetical protein